MSKQKHIYNLEEIVECLTKIHFRIFLLSNEKGKTNFNLENQVLYLNSSDIPNLNQILKKISDAPFEIKQNPKLETDLYFDATHKILYSKNSVEKELTKIEKWEKELFASV